MTTLVLQVGQSSDDCDRFGNAGFSLTATSFYVDKSVAKRQDQGARFTNVTIPNATTINGAFLTIRALLSTTPSTSGVIIRTQLTDNAATFSTRQNYDGRVRSGSSSTWILPNPWTAGTDYDSVSFPSIIQLIVDRALWVSGNALVVFLISPRVTTVEGHSFDTPAAVPPKLTIDYGAAPPAAGAVPQLQLQKAGQ